MKFTQRFTRRLLGFTIVELLVVLAILGVLSTALLPLGETLLRAQQERELRLALWEIRNAIDAYKKVSDLGAIGTTGLQTGYPPDLKALTAGAPDARPASRGQALYFLRRLPRDPFADPALPADQTWRLRSYASPPDRPAPGADVFDIASSSNETAQDGSRYAAW